ncbi:YbgA family protein [Natranaerofaba carboxydovora]|uniref:YbgA family protein n=1 Tax=Natranaerofaba carboxydovora TaxID=2742683 RepID=UPI001F148ABC|nr:DUF523 and DUF1722 domain-containing protein [Natranaerofaba carboxydovora]UMZ74970.1 hypothetical protein ACONDI_02576 [Natranaerofaba carboxydovora]
MDNNTAIKPRILISKCLGFSHCRFDGSIFNEDFVNMLDGFVDFIPVCPEVEIGLGVPRDVLRLYRADDSIQIYQKETDKNLTSEFVNYSENYLSSLDKIEGAIFKTRSPSCALKDAKVYPDKESNIAADRSPGLFAKSFQEKYPKLPAEDEGRLKNQNIRESFLTRIFTLKRFNYLANSSDVGVKDLIDYHANHKYLFMSLNQEVMKELGRTLARQKEMSIEELFNSYEKGLYEIINTQDNAGKKINVLLHVMGHFKDLISSEEKEFLLDNIDKYKENKLPISVPLSILKSWAIKYEETYILSQYFFEPFPEELISLEDSGKNKS